MCPVTYLDGRNADRLYLLYSGLTYGTLNLIPGNVKFLHIRHFQIGVTQSLEQFLALYNKFLITKAKPL